MTPDEAMFFLEVFIAKPKNPLKIMDLENIYVNKDFVPVKVNKTKFQLCKQHYFQIMKRQLARGKIIRIGGVLKNYEIQGPDINQLIFERARFLGMKPKQKKKKRDFG